MKNELIVDVQQNEITIALTENDRLQEVNKEEKNIDNYSVGNIYLGRVKKLLPALNAVFVDVGYEKEAFLHFLDLGPDFLTTQNYLSKAMSDRRKAPSMLRIQRMATLGKEGHIVII
jgi:ribonuclease G